MITNFTFADIYLSREIKSLLLLFLHMAHTLSDTQIMSQRDIVG